LCAYGEYFTSKLAYVLKKVAVWFHGSWCSGSWRGKNLLSISSAHCILNDTTFRVNSKSKECIVTGTEMEGFQLTIH
jgi:hypothetical protein